MPTMIESFKAAARAGVPIVAIKSPDQNATLAAIRSPFDAKRPLIKWDICTGMVPLNDKARLACQRAGIEPALTQNPVEALSVALKLPAQTLLFMQNMHLLLEGQPTLIQAVANARDLFKADQRMLVMTGPDFVLGPELARDVIVIDEPLPEQESIEGIVRQQYSNAGLKEPAPKIIKLAGQVLLGTSLFEAEQISATSLTKEGLDFDLLEIKKRLMIGQTPGMSLSAVRETFADIGGLEQAKKRFVRIINGQADIGLIMFLDEIEKMMGGAAGDTSGVSQDFHGQFLSWMQDNYVLGLVLVGAPGAGKSFIAKALASMKASGKIPCIVGDVGAMKSSLVGSSEARFRNFLKVARALTQSRILVIATCNDLSGLSPELKSRFTLGTYFFDLPNEVERSTIWPLYLNQFKHTPYESLPDELKAAEWTGREIRACCEIAWNEGIDLQMASENIVPVSLTDAERLNRLREAAHNTFLSASYPGPFKKDRKPEGGRQIGWDNV